MMGILKAYPVLAAGLFYVYYYDGEQTGLYSAVPLKTRSLSSPLGSAPAL